MRRLFEPTTERLQLRQWRDSDRPAFAEMSADDQLMRYFPKTLSRTESDAIIDLSASQIEENGWGAWAVELRQSGEFIGIVGLVATMDLPPSPCVEVLWRIARPHWGKGYATEAASAALSLAFDELDLDRVLAFVVPANASSLAVMHKLGMSNTHQDFEHPRIEPGSELSTHLVYEINRQTWTAAQ